MKGDDNDRILLELVLKLELVIDYAVLAGCFLKRRFLS